jgi:hypothetical protein
MEALRLSREEHHAEDTLPPPAPQAEEQPRVEARVESRDEPRIEPRIERPIEPKPSVDPRELLESSGLVMIETDRSKAPPVAPQAEEPQHLGRPRRERPRPAAQDDELVQVETAKK